MPTTHPPQPLPDVADAISIKFSGTVGGQPFMHLLHAHHDPATPNGTDLTSLAVLLNTWWTTNIKPLQSSVAIMNSVVCTDISDREGAVGTSSTASTGTLSGSLPNNTAYAVGWAIPRRYRGGHPRTYHTGIHPTQLNGTNQVTSAFRTGVLLAWNSIIPALAGAAQPSMPNLKLCQVSYYSGKNTDGSPLIRPTPKVDLITQSKGDLRIDSQRHRLGRPL